MIEHFELAQASKCELLGASKNGDKILDTLCEFDGSKFMRLSIEPKFPDLIGSQLEAFKQACLLAHQSEEFFLSINAENQWIRTIVGHEKLHPKTWAKSSISDYIFQSNILPYNPYWSQLRDRANRKLPHFPSCMLQEAIEEEKSLQEKLREWRESGGCCMLGMHNLGAQSPPETWFWEIKDADVKFEASIAQETISRVIWRGGRFVRKETGRVDTAAERGLEETQDTEFEIVKRVGSHPNIVYGFGELWDGTAYFMEYMSIDLGAFIGERKRVHPRLPPFSSHDTLDMLLQFAEAMKYMHQQGVVHCDLKSANILICQIVVADNASHYLVKVADFGSARKLKCSDFKAGGSTDNYAAPEALQQRKNMSFSIDNPDRIDVYSFGIVAFEILTGEIRKQNLSRKSKEKFRKRVIEDHLRPLLRTECQTSMEIIKSHKDKGNKQNLLKTMASYVKNVFVQEESPPNIDEYWHLHNEELLSLIESCWHPDPPNRPTFVEICDELKKVKDRKSGRISNCDPVLCQGNSVAGPSAISKTPSEGVRDSKQPALDSSPSLKRARSSNMCDMKMLGQEKHPRFSQVSSSKVDVSEAQNS